MQKTCISFFIFSILMTFLKCSSAVKPIIEIEMSSEGFHRDLLYTVKFHSQDVAQHCEYILWQQFPPAVYISVDQLEDLQRLKKLNAIFPKFVDVELPTEKATSFSVLLKGVPKLSDKIRLPIHFRYHSASPTQTSATVKIDTPTMYISCENEEDISPFTISKVDYCLDTEQCIVTTEKNVNLNCKWRELDAVYRVSTALIAEIPVGNSKSYTPVLYATIILSWAVSLWTVFRTNTVSRRINQRLEEHRILQKQNS